MRKTAVLAALALPLACAASKYPDELKFTYTVDERVSEKRPGSLNDGIESDPVTWKNTPRVFTCNLASTCDLRLIEIAAAKYTKWYLLKEIQVSVDDGSGEFSDPVVIKGYFEPDDFKGPLVDKSCTNHHYRVENPGRAARVKVRMSGDAAMGVSEIRLCGKPAEAPASAARKAPAVTAKEKGSFRTYENSHYKMSVNPLGGRVMSLWSKDIGAELTNPEACGSFMEYAWNIRASREFLHDKPFTIKSRRGRGSLEVEALGHAKGGGVDFLEVRRTYVLRDDSTAFGIEYSFHNLPDAMSDLTYGMLVHTSLGLFGDTFSHLYPTLDGIHEVKPGARPADLWIHRPARGWLAVANGSGKGLAITMPYRDVNTFYSMFSNDGIPSLEWRMTPVTVKCDGRLDVSVQVIPFDGLSTVSGAGGGFVGEIRPAKAEAAPGDKVQVGVHVVGSKAGKASCELFARRAGTDKWEKAAGSALSFAKPGAIASFSAEVSRADAGLLELEAVVRGADGTEAARLDACVRFGKSADRWSIDALEARRESAAKSIDLTGYTNYVAAAATPWAKPLAGGPLRVVALTGRGNNAEIGRLTRLFDIVPLTTQLDIGRSGPRKLGNPIFGNGDHFGIINGGDIEANLLKTLKKPCDAILVGGIPWEAWPDAARKALLERVKSGVGLVWIGEEKDAPELNLSGLAPKTVRGIPKPATAAFADVPFQALGSEEAYAFAPAGTVHATVGGAPYLSETSVGAGKVFTLAYKAIFGQLGTVAGLTPNLRDYYADHAAPADHYLSMIAKCLFAASGRTPEVSFASAEVTARKASFEVDSTAGRKTTWELTVENRWGERLARGAKEIRLGKGRTRVPLDKIAMPAYAGTLVLRITVSDADGKALNWGAWAFENAPAASLSKLKAAADHVEDGGEVPFTAEVAGDAAGRTVEFSLVDSYGRTLDTCSADASGTVSGSLKARNGLVSRFCSLQARLKDGKRTIDRLQAPVVVRPDPAKWPWDDFEIGAWINDSVREYLWPDVERAYRSLCLSLVIANPYPMQTAFPARYNFTPTYLSGAGLGQCPEPVEYAKTGDKMKLVRTPCLSDPEFLERQAKGKHKAGADIAKYGMRFVWFGDEQSLTGYGGKATDFCFSPHCVAAFREFLKGRYGTLEALNGEWETDFRTWDDVLPFTRQEVWDAKGRHVAGWSDHLEFMDGRLVNSLQNACDAMRAEDPNLMFSMSGTQEPSAYGGMDWWRQLKVIDSALNYATGGQYDIHRSFRPDGGFMPWAWGYANKGKNAVNSVWRTIFLGSRGIMGFQTRSMLNGDGSLTQGMRDTMPSISRIAGGIGKHLVNNLASRHDAAILYSQPSIRAAFIENRKEEHTRLREKYIALMKNLAVGFDFVSCEQLTGGILAKRGYKALVLPDSTALSDAEIAAVKAFAAAGGTIVAEGVPATRTANCRPRGESALSSVFTGRSILVPKVDFRYLKALEYPMSKDSAPIIEAEQKRLAAALGLSGGGTVSIVDKESGAAVRHAETYVRADSRGSLLFGVISSEDKARQVVFKFPRKGHVTNLVTGRQYGVADTLDLPLGKGIVYGFELMDQRPELAELKADASGRVRAAFKSPCDTVVAFKVFRPDGKEAPHYSRKCVVKGDAVETTVPFALSDPSGTWRVTAADVVGGDVLEAALPR